MRWVGSVAWIGKRKFTNTLRFWLGDNLEYISVCGENIKMDLK